MVTISPKVKQEVEYGNDATLNCSASGNPSPTISWRFGNEILASSSKYDISTSGNSSILIVKSLSRNDSGSYECYANNTKGNNSKTSELILLSKWKIYDCNVHLHDLRARLIVNSIVAQKLYIIKR